MKLERENLFERYAFAVRAFREATERSSGLAGPEFHRAMLEADRLYRDVEELELALADYDRAMR